MKGVQCYELFGGIALKIHTFSFFIFSYKKIKLFLAKKVLVNLITPRVFVAFLPAHMMVK